MTHIKGQSEAARNARLAQGCCPTHGLFMSQVSGWYETELQPAFTIVKCPRKDCDEAFAAQGFNDEKLGLHRKLSAQEYDVFMAAEKRVTQLFHLLAQVMDERDKAREGKSHD